MPSRAPLVAFVLLVNACAPFGAGAAATDEEPKPAATELPVVTETPATEPPYVAPPSAPDAGTDDGGSADAGPAPANDDCTLIDCLLH